MPRPVILGKVDQTNSYYISLALINCDATVCYKTLLSRISNLSWGVFSSYLYYLCYIYAVDAIVREKKFIAHQEHEDLMTYGTFINGKW